MNQPIRKRLFSGAAGTLALTVRRATTLTATRAAMLLLVMMLTMTAQTAWAEWVTYIDENGTKKEEANATELNGGGATTLTAGLYVVKHDITYTGTVTLSGNVKIVLNDGCTMNIGTSESRLSGKGFYYNSNESLTIYGQTNGTGALSVYTTGESNYAIYAGAITINGGHVTADTNGQDGHAIYAEAITINGGHVTAHTAGNDARAIYSRISAFTYNGGIVSASTEDTSSFDYRYNAPAIASYGNYTFNWRSATDRITIGSTGLSFDPNAPSGYEKTATFSKPFSDGTTTYSGTLTGNELSALAGKTLLPAYTITYDLAGGTVATDNPDSYTIESAAITLNNPTREGYTFAGWTGTGLDAATTTVTIAAGSSGNREYTATWTAIEYSIKYNGLDGATFSTTYNSYTIESADIALDTPAKTGYDFGGWYANSSLTGDAVTTIAAGSYGDVELWAKWTAATTLALTANQAPDGNYWTTFYCGDAGYTIDDGENACAYTAEYDGTNHQLTLHKLGKTIAKGEAVIIVADNNEVSMTKGEDGTCSDDNDLHGMDVETATADIQTTLGEGTFYVLGMTTVGTEQHFGFHKYEGTEMAARKAFVLVNGNGAALARSLTMVFDDEATGIKTTDFTDYSDSEDAWYTLDGRRLQGKPAKSGIYVNNGRKVVIK